MFKNIQNTEIFLTKTQTNEKKKESFVENKILKQIKAQQQRLFLTYYYTKCCGSKNYFENTWNLVKSFSFMINNYNFFVVFVILFMTVCINIKCFQLVGVNKVIVSSFLYLHLLFYFVCNNYCWYKNYQPLILWSIINVFFSK